jgi:hypothetical protein
MSGKNKVFHKVICPIIIYVFVTLIGCAPVVKDHIIIPEIEIKKDEKIVPHSLIEKPKKPNPILYNSELAEVKDISEVEYFAFTSDEFKKIIQLSKSFDAQRELIETYIDLINLKIGINNDLIDIIDNKKNMTQYYADLYINENNIRVQENYIREREKILDKSIIIIQSIVLLAIVL